MTDRTIASALLLALLLGGAVESWAGDASDAAAIEALRRGGDAAAFSDLRDEYVRGGPMAAIALEAAVAVGGEDGLDLAAQALADSRTRRNPAISTAVANAMNEHDSAKAMEMLERGVHT